MLICYDSVVAAPSSLHFHLLIVIIGSFVQQNSLSTSSAQLFERQEVQELDTLDMQNSFVLSEDLLV